MHCNDVTNARSTTYDGEAGGRLQQRVEQEQERVALADARPERVIRVGHANGTVHDTGVVQAGQRTDEARPRCTRPTVAPE